MIRGSLKLFCIAVIFLSLSGCKTFDIRDYGPGAYIIKGTMHFVDVEGGCWQFSSESGENYELASDDTTDIYQDGVEAKLIVRNLTNTSSICMVGKIVQVLEIIQFSPQRKYIP